MRLFLPFLLIVLLAGLIRPVRAGFPQSYVYVDVNFVILVKANGETIPKSLNPERWFNPALPADVAEANRQADAMLEHATELSVNPVMDNNWRGLRYRRLGDVKFVSSIDGDATFRDRVDSLFRSYYPPTFAGTQAYDAFDPEKKLAAWGPTDPLWKWSMGAANFYLVGGFGGGVGFGSDNLMVQGGFWTNPATHEFGHWFSLPHTFRADGGQGQAVCYWGDDDLPQEHGDGFSDTLIDHVGCVITLDDAAGRLYQNGDGSPKTYSQLTSNEQTNTRNWVRDFYAYEFFNRPYSQLNVNELQRIPPFDINAPMATTADRDRLSIFFYGVPYAPLTTGEKANIDWAIANPAADWWFGKGATFWMWYVRVDNDLIAKHNFNVFYDQTDAWQKEQMRRLDANIIAYRAGKGSPYGIYSELQNDRLCDQISGYNTGYGERGATRAIGSGKYVFMGGGANNTMPAGSSLNPHNSLHNTVLAATTNAVVIARPGTYARPSASAYTITKPMTIRATKDGPAVIGN